jgi:glycosyltransferase involved in cell wall biosynthesis
MISVLVPTVRPQNIPKIQKAVEAEGLEVEFIWEEDTEHIGCPKMLKRLVEKSNGELICFLGDDTEPQPGFLKNAVMEMLAQGAWLVGFNDEHTKNSSHWLADKRLLDHLENREFFYTGYEHNRCDVELRLKATALGKYIWAKDAIVRHNHPIFNSGVLDEHYERGALNAEKFAHDIQLFQERNCKIAVAMIVKNESACLEKCLESVKWADAIYIEDTGSLDDTVKIARRYADKVSYREWTDSFAEARNSVKAKVKEDWILSIDADEILHATEHQVRAAVLKHVESASIGITMQGKEVSSFIFPRLFKNIPEVSWSGAIHNTLQAPNQANAPEIVIEYGHSPAHALDKNRAFRILKAEHEKDPKNTRIMYYLAREHYYRKEYLEAVNLFDEYLAISTFKAERADAYYLKATCLWALKRGEEARLACLNALNLNANFKRAAKLMAEMSWPVNARVWLAMAEAGNNQDLLFVR